MKIAVTSASFSKNKELVNRLKSIWTGKVVLNTEGLNFNQKELIAFLQDCDAAIIGLDNIDDEVLSNLPKLKYISKYGVGLDNIDEDACKTHSISVGWTGGVNKTSVAEMTVAFSLSLIRNLYQSSIRLKNGEWKKNGGYQLKNKTVGIIGFGHIGKEVFRLLQPFTSNILVNDINEDVFSEYKNLSNSSKDEIYEHADIITVHTPLTKDTKYLFSKNQFLKMKNCPIIINTSRGNIINEEDAIEALDSNQIRSIGIDVYSSEPTPYKKLINREDVFCTPHIGGNAHEAVLNMGHTAIDNMLNLVKEND